MIDVNLISDDEIKENFEIASSISELAGMYGIRSQNQARQFVAKLANKIGIDYHTFYPSNKFKRCEYESHPRHCLECDKELTYEQRKNKFCSSSCAATYNNKKYPKRHKQCKEIHTPEHVIKFQKWLNGENYTVGGFNVPSAIRRYLKEKYNNSCQVCGWNVKHPITSIVPLSIHHVDGDCTNNKMNNLQLLCPNCHSLTDNFGSLNANSRRFHNKRS